MLPHGMLSSRALSERPWQGKTEREQIDAIVIRSSMLNKFQCFRAPAVGCDGAIARWLPNGVNWCECHLVLKSEVVGLFH